MTTINVNIAQTSNLYCRLLVDSLDIVIKRPTELERLIEKRYAKLSSELQTLIESGHIKIEYAQTLVDIENEQIAEIMLQAARKVAARVQRFSEVVAQEDLNAQADEVEDEEIYEDVWNV